MAGKVYSIVAYCDYLYRHTRVKNALYPACKDWSFEDYVRWNVTPEVKPLAYRDKPQTTHLSGVRVDSLMRFENIEEDFNALPIVKTLRITLPRKNARLRDTPWQPFYTAELAAQVYAWAELDFIKYGYAKDSWRDIPCETN